MEIVLPSRVLIGARPALRRGLRVSRNDAYGTLVVVSTISIETSAASEIVVSTIVMATETATTIILLILVIALALKTTSSEASSLETLHCYYHLSDAVAFEKRLFRPFLFLQCRFQ